ncbi:MAG: tetratricopeptide repeat protein [Candidatus Omnitrophota bacterium]
MKRPVIITIISISCILSNASSAFADAASKVRKGIKAYEAQNYDQALIDFNDAQTESPLSPEIFFNMGNVFYRQKKYKEAQDAFEKSRQNAEIQIEAKALYNIGNALFAQGRLPEALQAYKQSLEINPDDLDTKYNIEYTENKIKEMLSRAQETQQQAKQDQAQKEQPPQESEQAAPQESESPAQPAEQNNQSAQEKDTQTAAQDQAQKEQLGEPEGEDTQDVSRAQAAAQKQETQNQEKLTKEEAERFLSAFEQDQKDMLSNQKDRQKGWPGNVEKDW